MRLSQQEIDTIKKLTLKKDQEALVYLYGSRLDDSAAGADIDLLVVSEHLKFKDKIDLLIDLKDKLGEQKIDLSIKSSSQLTEDPYHQELA